MTTYNWYDQTLVAPTFYELRMVSNTAMTPSVLTRVVSTANRAGEGWEMSLTWSEGALSGQERAAVIAFFTRLNGQEHRCKIPFFGHQQYGVLTGTPLVDGAAQTGNTLNIDGATASQTPWARAGDIVAYGNSIHMVTADADSDGAGDVALPIWPAIRNSPANNATLYVDPTAADLTNTFILKDPVSIINSAMQRKADDDLWSDLTITLIDDVGAE